MTTPKGSNRTFMELKFAFADGIVFESKRSNRTFMELKSNICENSIFSNMF